MIEAYSVSMTFSVGRIVPDASEKAGIVEREFDPLATHADDALITFLRAGLALGFTYAQTRKVEADLDSEGENRARKLATDAVKTIHRFWSRIRVGLPIRLSGENFMRALLNLKNFYPSGQRNRFSAVPIQAIRVSPLDILPK
jgi:hypothetical protein